MHSSATGAAADFPELDFLRVVTCGSVDNGKSTLVGRLLHDLGALNDDQLRDIAGAEEPDFSLALDGLAAEREQGITIDVAYRSFSSQRRRFLVADVPGHEQYTRNMITGASTADVALLVVDAANGISQQTRRHTYLARLLGIRCFVLAVNKMDIVHFSREVFESIVGEYRAFLAQLETAECYPIPVSARFGDNVVQRSRRTEWFYGPTVDEALHQVQFQDEREEQALRFPVQWVNRAVAEGRGYSGTVLSGKVAVGKEIEIIPSEQRARVAQLLTFDGKMDEAVAGQSITVVLDRDVDVGRGHLICAANQPASTGDSFEAMIFWMSDTPLVRGRSYRLKIGTQTVPAQIARAKGLVQLDTLSLAQAETLAANDIGICDLTLDGPVAFDAYEANRDTGGFILIDRVSNDTVAAGLIRSGELRLRDVPWQAIDVSKASRAALKNHPSAVLWFTGIPGAGKSTIANLVERMLHARGCHTYILDGDNIRHGLSRDLGFSDADRVENIRRVGEVAALMADAGLIVLVALVSPFRADRRTVRERIGEDFVEIFVDTSLEVAVARDVKGHYQRALAGELRSFTGIGSGYEAPEKAELHIVTATTTAEEAARQIVSYLEFRLSGAVGSSTKPGEGQ